ncbi:MAG: tetratricopeptide repeat protein [Chitinispirillaceae bacterium]|nr:tetratricopeptide repeat protein [Chitinispirillaceae bacterium]
MNIKFSKQKQELREDPVLEFFFSVKAWVSKYRQVMTVLGVVVLLCLGGFMLHVQTQRSGLEKAVEAFGNAMVEFNNNNEKAVGDFKIVAEQYRKTPQGAMSAHMLGSIYFNQGSYDEAIQWFQKVSTSEKELGFIVGEALEGIAGCYEAKNDLPRALEYLEKALKDDAITYRHPAIRWKMALFNQKINNVARTLMLCRDILSDTTAAEFRQKAENLQAALTAATGS